MPTVRTLIGNIKGPKGDTGATGATGPQGPGATIEVGTVSTTAYGNPVQITNSGTETDAVFDFVIPQGKPGEQTTKMSLLTLDTITTQTAEYPIPAVGDVGSTAWGKIVKFFNDIKTAVTGKVDKTSIVNNLTSTATDVPLSAAQGKALNDALTTVNTKVTNRLKGYTTGSGTLNSQYWEESTLRYYIQDNLCFVYVSGHLKQVTGFTEIIVGSNFPKSIGSNYNISCVMDNDMNVVGMFSVNALGQFSITTRKALTASSTTVTGRLAYVIQDNYAP